MNTNLDKAMGAAILLIMLFFVGVQLVSLAGFAEAQWQLAQSPESVVKKVAVDYGGSAFHYTVQRHYARNGAGIGLNLLFIMATFSAICILWSAIRGDILKRSNITASWIISVTLLLAIPLQWKFNTETQIIETYERAAAAGKAILSFMTMAIRLDLYPFLVIGIALTFSFVLRKALEMKTELDGTV